MPTVGLFSQQYWNGNRHTNQVITPLAPGKGGYPTWQSSVSMTLIPVEAIRVFSARVRWCWAMLRALWRVPTRDRGWVRDWLDALPTLSREERYVCDELRHLLAAPLWQDARQAVARTATTQGFNDAKFWKSISTKVHADPGHAAQLFRHLHAVQQLKDRDPSVSSHARNFAVEVAYHAFTQIPKRTV